MLKNEHFANTHTLRNATDTQVYIMLPLPKNLLNVLAINLCINVADVMEDFMQDTQAISELEAILNILSLPRL